MFEAYLSSLNLISFHSIRELLKQGSKSSLDMLT